MAKEHGLGKGLGALLGDAAVTQVQQEGQGSYFLPISQVQPGLNQPRKRFDEDALQDLADSIRLHGVIQPLTVRRLSSGYYQIIAGERRWRAAKLAGLTEVPAVIIEADEQKVMELGLIENLQREDLNPVEEAKGYEVLMKEHGLTQEEVAQRVGKSRPAIANAVRLLALPDPVLQLLEEGELSAGHARTLLSLATKNEQRNLAQQIVNEGLSVRQAEALVAKHIRDREREPELPHVDPYKMYREAAAKELADRFGRKVTIYSATGGKGRIELAYYDDNDLNDLLSLLEQVTVSAKSKEAKGGSKA